MERKKKAYIEVVKIYPKNKSTCEIVKREKEIHASLLEERSHSCNFYYSMLLYFIALVNLLCLTYKVFMGKYA